MKKQWLLMLVLVVLVFGCSQGNDITGGTVTLSEFQLSEFQISACQYAAANDNCDRLQDLSLVSADNCCSTLDLCCISITLDEFKSALISGIVSYFSDTPTLSLPELKDMLSAYFSSSDVVDLNVIGQNSGEKLIYIYNKAKGTCTPNCAGKVCGANNCGSSCGTCQSGYTCSNGQCVSSCVLNCAGKVCGDDGCGSSCGTCQSGYTCSNGQCVVACIPKTCSQLGKQCGYWPDGCGGTLNCSVCAAGKVCAGVGECVAPVYLPDNQRYIMSTSQGGRYEYIFNVSSDNHVHLGVSIIGLDNEVICTYTWTLPDGTAHPGAVMATNINGGFQLRTRNYGYPNIPYDYIPSGNHLLRIDSTGSGRLLIRASVF